MVSRDVTFNEKDLFNGNLNNLGNELWIRTRNEWDDWLNSLKVLQSQSTTNSTSLQDEDEELSSIAGDKSVGHRVEIAAVSDQQAQAGDSATGDHEVYIDGIRGDYKVYIDGIRGDYKVYIDGIRGDYKVYIDGTSSDYKAHPEGVSKGNAALESDQLYNTTFTPYLILEPMPPPPAALLAAAIRGSTLEQDVRAAFSATYSCFYCRGEHPSLYQSAPWTMGSSIQCWSLGYPIGYSCRWREGKQGEILQTGKPLCKPPWCKRANLSARIYAFSALASLWQTGLPLRHAPVVQSAQGSPKSPTCCRVQSG